MAAREPETIRAEIAQVEAKAKARRGRPGFKQNLVVIDARLDELRAELAAAEESNA